MQLGWYAVPGTRSTLAMVENLSLCRALVLLLARVEQPVQAGLGDAWAGLGRVGVTASTATRQCRAVAQYSGYLVCSLQTAAGGPTRAGLSCRTQTAQRRNSEPSNQTGVEKGG